MKTNYHTHNYRCKHAMGDNEDYIRVAIKAGLDEIGLSDHLPHPGKDIDNDFRMDYKELDEYFKDIDILKEKYKNEISILKGMECEYFKEYDWLYNELKEKYKVDYLILGAHFFKHNNSWYYVGDLKLNKDILEEYVDYVVESMESGYFNYIAHPDLFGMTYKDWDEHTIKASRRIFEAAERLNIPIEINVAGMRRGKIKYNKGERYLYPIKDFWELSKEYKVKRIIGIDAHDPNHLKDLEMGREFAKKIGIDVIEKLDL